MINKYERARYETLADYELLFYVDETGGYAFPCDERGQVTLAQDSCAMKNYQYCMAHPEEFPYIFGKIHKIERTHRIPATGICHCGRKIALWDDYMGACECPKCGQWYNIFGQELTDPRTWRDGGDW